jgi:Ca-activated chloride channel family protein
MIPRWGFRPVTSGPRAGRASLTLAVVILSAMAWAQGAHAQSPSDPRGVIRLVFLYGSEKKTWVTEATEAFNKAEEQRPDGERIRVEAKPAGSNVVVGDALKGDVNKPETQIHIVSPASRIFMDIANGEAIELGQKPVVNIDEMLSLVNSPLIVATWPKLAEALGWDVKPPSWREVFKYSAEPQAFGRFRARWGSYKYGHTHPDYSNSGLLAAVAEVYAGLDKYDPAHISLADMKSATLTTYLAQVEGGVIHYGESTGFFATKMFDDKAGGPRFLSAAILYENLVFEENKKAQQKEPASYAKLGPKVVAIYPAEGTFSNEHPVAVVEREWVTPQHRDAARKYIAFLRSLKWQERARDLGFRPVIEGLPVDAVLKTEYGVEAGQFNIKQPLKIPPYSIIKEIRPAWRRAKRPADIVLAIDTSLTMNEMVKIGKETKRKIELAEEAAKEFVKQLSDGDNLTVITFSDDAAFVLEPDNPGRKMDRNGKAQVADALTDMIAGGQTALYDAVDMAYTALENRGTRSNRGIVVLTDGRHEKGEAERLKLEARKKVIDKIFNDGEKNIFIFTIGYGDPSDPRSIDEEFLKELASKSKGRYFPANPVAKKPDDKPVDIRQVLRDIVTFF